MIHDKALDLVRALRSGDYQQGRANLCLKDRYCCLGVACAIAGVSEPSVNDKGLVSWEGDHILPPNKIVDHYGMYSWAGNRRDLVKIVIDGVSYDHLAAANDMGCTFAQIADYVEQNWEYL